VWLWGDMVLLDSSLHFFGAFFDFAEQHSNKFF